MKAPRLMIIGESGSGKSTILGALILALKSRGLSIRPACCSPDFSQLRRLETAGTYAASLDVHMAGESSILSLFAKAAIGCDTTVIEGYWDFSSDLKNENTAQVARLTDTSAVYVLDGREERSLEDLVRAYQSKDKHIRIVGVVFNHSTAEQYRLLSQYVFDHTGLQSFGYLDELLLSADATLDIDGLLKQARLAQVIEVTCKEMGVCTGCGACDEMSFAVCEEPIPVALAYDEAFDAYYKQGLMRIEQMGVRFLPFSPLAGESVPKEAKGLMLCGRAELAFAMQLSDKIGMLNSIAHVAKFLPVWAEGIGAVVLCEKIIMPDASALNMSGVVKGYAVGLESLAHTGYATLTSKSSIANGLHVYERRFFDLNLPEDSDSGNLIQAVNSKGEISQSGMVYDNFFITDAHLHPYGCERAIRRFVTACSKI